MDSTIQHTLITIGGVNYDIDVSQILYLSSFVDFQGKAQPQGTKLVHGPIPLIDVALKGIQSGYRQCFRALPPDLSQHHILCETYDFLGIDILGEQYVDQIFADLKACKTDYELEYKRYLAIKGNKSKARDAAFKLLYLILMGEFRDENKDSMKVFNAVLFIVSHSATFKWKTRTMIRAAYQERFVVTLKQIARLDEWLKGDTADDVDGDNTTTDESSDENYNSDYS
ncbi:uncharacterized protein K460DRAFT_289359 [Cucurbitaria berberidis CBS 394.84]|uniref:Uncharacterized protein n=1 Tax=Cucurbitaria berberidis CBS 394.84 TaxID=1168544 RepID=A0A9P4GDG8_9PLEO|nr:uncharacterized protein K460DRAFT_289359 [Cucurbitaria berberidis CBS 394.84]KAF1843205.1 hypothetical protein K460DRAFT_289359 [Cucurbitaria berberidis CBS 394.84]